MSRFNDWIRLNYGIQTENRFTKWRVIEMEEAWDEATRQEELRKSEIRYPERKPSTYVKIFNILIVWILLIFLVNQIWQFKIKYKREQWLDYNMTTCAEG